MVRPSLGGRASDLLHVVARFSQRLASLQDTRLDGQIANMEFRLERTEVRLRAQYTALDSLLARLTVTSDFLAQQLQSLPGSSARNG